MNEKKGGSHKGHHKGNSTEELINKELVLKELNILPGQAIIDAGCGDGYMSREFSKILSGTGKVYAVEPVAEKVELLRESTEGTIIEPMQADMTRTTPLEKSSIDLIYVSTVYHIFSEEQKEGFNKEAKRLLKPGGRLAIVEIHKGETPFGPPAGMRCSPEELKRTVDLTPGKIVEVGQYFYMQTFINLE